MTECVERKSETLIKVEFSVVTLRDMVVGKSAIKIKAWRVVGEGRGVRVRKALVPSNV